MKIDSHVYYSRIIKTAICFLCTATTTTWLSCSQNHESSNGNKKDSTIVHDILQDGVSVQKFECEEAQKKPEKAVPGDWVLDDEDRLYIEESEKILKVDLDRDGVEGFMVFSRLIPKDKCDGNCDSLVVDAVEKDVWLLRQELDGLFSEYFYDYVDIDGDTVSELITKNIIGRNCSPQCDGFSIYKWMKNGSFELACKLIGMSPNHHFVKFVLMKLTALRQQMMSYYLLRTGSEHPCGYWVEESTDCLEDVPYLMDSNNDGLYEIVQMLRPPPYEENGVKKNIFSLLILELYPNYTLRNKTFFPIETDEAEITVLGFLNRSPDNVHMLININYIGTTAGYPIMEAVEINGSEVSCVGVFYGFYIHAVPDRLQDLDYDGDVEILDVGEVIWPHDAPHSDILIFLDISEYRDGEYVNANDKYPDHHKRINLLSIK